MSVQRRELTCSCGAKAVLEDMGGVYINPGGAKDAKGRFFAIEVRADEWLDRHQVCITRGRS